MYAIRDAHGTWVEISGGFETADVQYPANWLALALPEEREAIGVAEIIEQEQPAGVRLLGSVLDDADGSPTRRWLTEPIVPVVPQVVSPRQLRLALLGAGLLDGIDAFVSSADVPEAARISWEYATEFRRDDPMLNQMAAAMDPPMTPAQMDALFVAAAAIP